VDSLQEAQEPSGKVSEVKERSGGNEVGEVKQVRAVSEEAHGYKKPMCGGGEGSPLLKKTEVCRRPRLSTMSLYGSF